MHKINSYTQYDTMLSIYMYASTYLPMVLNLVEQIFMYVGLNCYVV